MQSELLGLLRNPPPLWVIGNPIDLDATIRLSRPPVKIQGNPALLAVGRLTYQKGFDLLVRSLPEIKRRLPLFHLTILGDGPARAELNALANSLAVSSEISYIGFVTNPYPWISAADLLISTSRYEGFPNVILEAMALGCPVVATDCPGATKEMVIHGVTGRVVQSSEPANLATEIERAIKPVRPWNRTEIQRLCNRKYSSVVIARRYQQLLESL